MHIPRSLRIVLALTLCLGSTLSGLPPRLAAAPPQGSAALKIGSAAAAPVDPHLHAAPRMVGPRISAAPPPRRPASEVAAATLGVPQPLGASAIPAEARAMLPPGCLQVWPAAAGQPSANRPGGDLPGGDLLGGDLGADPAGRDPLSSLGPATEDPLAADPLSQLGPSPPSSAESPASLPTGPPDRTAPAEDPHRALFLEDSYPSALACAKCHPQQYEQWSVSAHAYAVVSPMYQRFEQKMLELTQGTVGHFCMRCHAPVATQLEYPREASVLDAPAVIREGITCVACHRVRETYGETNGGRRIEPGDVFQPVYGPNSGTGVQQAISDREQLKLKTDPEEPGPGQAIHRAGIQFEPLSRSDFCLSCHQVAVHPGIALEVVYSQYRAGPASAQGVTCQQCHMGQVPGKPAGFACAPIAEVAGKPYGEPQKQANHMFWGPGYSIAHPGIFPQNEKAQRWSPRQWLLFEWQQGWGTEEFERAYRLVEAAAPSLPAPWDNADERRDARRVLDANLRLLAVERRGSIATMEAGSAIEGPLLSASPQVGQPLRFAYRVHNTSEGHNLPTGSLGAQPQVWLNVALVAPDGQTVWESGYLDSQGDLADLHSADVAHGRIPRDGQLLNLQTKFLITNLKGTDREVSLPINIDVDPLPFLRPGAVPVSVLNHPPLIRMEARSIPPLDRRTAHYVVPADRLRTPGLYRLDVRLRSRVEPAYFMRFVGLPDDLIHRMTAQILDIHTASHPFYVAPPGQQAPHRAARSLPAALQNLVK